MNKASSWRYDFGKRPTFRHTKDGTIRPAHVLEGGGVEINGNRIVWSDDVLTELGRWLIATFGEGES